MYENDIYSGSGAGNNMSGAFSGNNEFGNSSINAGSTGRNYANRSDEISGGNASGAYGGSDTGGAGNAYGSTGTGYAGNVYGSYQTNSSAFQQNMDNGGGQGGGHNAEAGRRPKRKAAFFRKAMLSVSLGLCFGLFSGVGFFAVQQAYGAMDNGSTDVVSNVEVPVAGDNNSGIGLTKTSNLTYVESDITGVVADVMPAMVSIVNNYTETGYIFGGQYSRDQAASGSGIIVAETDDELLIVSNNHVVADAVSLEVTFIDGTTATARIKGLDSDMDLAVIAISLEDLSADTRNAISIATLGESNELKLGEPVIAIGNALGYGQSVTNGIISALNREVVMEDGSAGIFIQTNAAINPGNSGGALLNIKGEVIGINSNKIGGTAVEGMGYAIPISSASPIIAELMERQTREVVAENEMGYMGIYMQAVTSDVAALYGFPEGIFISDVTDGSAAQAAGLKRQDIIVKFDGQKVTTPEGLQKLMQYYAAGDEVKVTVMRAENGEYTEYEFTVTLRERPAE